MSMCRSSHLRQRLCVSVLNRRAGNNVGVESGEEAAVFVESPVVLLLLLLLVVFLRWIAPHMTCGAAMGHEASIRSQEQQTEAQPDLPLSCMWDGRVRGLLARLLSRPEAQLVRERGKRSKEPLMACARCKALRLIVR
jgi:hypothetical protein